MSKTVGAAGSTGSNPKEVTPETTGTDKIIQKVGEVTNNTIPAVQDFANNTVNTIPSITKYLIIGIIIIVLIISGIGIFAIIKYYKNKKLTQEYNKII